MQIRNTLGIFFSLLLYFNISPSYAINGVAPDAQALNINCTNNQCLGSISATSKVFDLVLPKCTATNSTGCTTTINVNGFSNSNDALFSAYLSGANAAQPNINVQRYKPFQNCVVINDGSFNQDTKQCDVVIEKYENHSGTYKWVTYVLGKLQTTVKYTPTPNICPQSDGVYLPGLGCTTTATARVVNAIPSDCNDCLTQAMNSGIYPSVGNPISINSADKVELKQDLATPIAFLRNYSSNRVLNSTPTTLGNGWKHNYDKRLSVVSANNASGSYIGTLIFVQENDSEIIFTRLNANSNFAPAFKDQNAFSVAMNGANYVLTTPSRNKETYSAAGLLINTTYPNGYALNFAYTNNILSSITDSYGRSLTLTHTNGVLSQVLADNSDKIVYGYTSGNLTTAAFNTTEITTYGYTSNRLTSITNPNSKLMSEFAYDATGRATGTKGLSSTNNYIHTFNMDYSSPNSYKTTKGDGSSIAYSLTTVNSQKVLNNSVATDPTTYNTTSYGFTYDANGYPKSYSDGKSNITDFTYSPNGQLLSVKRPDYNETSYTYYPDSKLVEKISQNTSNGIRNIYYTYDTAGNVLSQSVETSSDTRTTNNTYTSLGKIATSTDPNGSITTYEYYPDNDTVLSRRGLLKKVTNGLGHRINITSYDSRGNPTTIVDSNGVSKTLTYDARSRVKTEKVGTATNSYNYDLAGNLLNTTLANGLVLTFTYDNSNRITSISDNNGNSQVYTLDPNNDQPTNIATNANSVLKHATNQVFDKLGRLTKLYRSNPNEYSQYTYDANNNITSDRNANGHIKNYSYNNLDQMYYSSGRDGYIDFTYDLDGNLKSAELGNKKTNYTYNDFGEMTSLISPETGTTNIEYNVSQNLVTKTDANGTTHTYESDMLGRMKNITHTNGATTQSEEFIYDSAINGIGKVASINNDNATISYEYDALGRISKKIQTVGSITKDIDYAYNAAGQLASMTYPSGLIVNYVYTKGLITSMTVSGSITGTVLDSATYHPFDNSFPKSYRFNSTKNRITNFDINEKLTSLTIDGITNNTFSMDGVGNFLNILDGMDNTKNIIATYDTNNKLYSYSQTGISFQPYYDVNYNRTSGGSSGQSMNFTYDYYNNRLNSYTLNGVSNAITYDNNGNSLTEGTANYTYDLRNNLISYNKGSANASYTFNALGQRVSKTVGSTTTNFLYDETTNLVGEYDNAGSTIAEHIYLNGVPVGLVKNNTLYYVHTDHLGTPRSITNSVNSIVWKWNNTDPFGGNLPTTQTVEYNKRFPGQYFDNESKLHYNYYRTYNPLIGRYIQSDPLGLAAGFNTYSYVGSNPLGIIDPTGEFGILGFALGAITDIAFQLLQNNGNYKCIDWGEVGLSSLAGSLGGGLYNGIWKIKNTGKIVNGNFKISNSWSATTSWLKSAKGPGKALTHKTGNEYHHWFIERNSKIGKMVPDKIKNQPWNLNPLTRKQHELMHGNGPGGAEYNILQKWWIGTPGWARGTQMGSIGGIVGPEGGENCGCQ